jgi:hypothetical protein
MGSARKKSAFGHGRALFAAAVLAVLVAVPVASAHIERASYWPNPAADNAGGVPTGGAVPAARSLASALDAAERGDTRVVCDGGQAVAYRAPGPILKTRQDVEVSRAKVNGLEQKLRGLRRKLAAANGDRVGRIKRQASSTKRRLNRAKRAYRAALAAEQAERKKAGAEYEQRLAQEIAAQQAYKQDLLQEPSMQRLDTALAAAQTSGYKLRPSEPAIVIGKAEADQLWDINARLLAQCDYSEIQQAVFDSGNNDRVVVMPGIYTEPTSRAQPTNDPACDGLEEQNDRPGGTGALSYRYQATCPNDQNLIAVIGRQPSPTPPPQPPLMDRHNIPDLGPCIRCNMQLEGSGVGPDDVVVDAGRVESGNAGPANAAKDVGIRIDRADGFVLRNVTVRHVREHGIYPHEVDGYRLERFKTFEDEEYGVLAFASDHALIQDCEAARSGDSGLYPGSAPDTGEQTVEGSQRYNTEIRQCDMHHNAAGYSGTDGNAVWIHDNDIYDNALGFTTDVFTAAGHPGFPQDSDLIENNEFHGNNFNPYLPACGDGEEPGPNGPDQDCSDINPSIPVPVGTGLWIAGGNHNELRGNHFYDNWRRGTMLFSVPDSFVCGDGPTANGNEQAGCNQAQVNTSYRNRFHDNVMGRTPGGTPDPNGTDFWWDQFPGTQAPGNGNCWYDNVGKDGTRATLTADPPVGPVPHTSVPGTLPEDCATSQGVSGGSEEAELLACLAAFDQGVDGACTWFTTPAEPQP